MKLKKLFLLGLVATTMTNAGFVIQAGATEVNHSNCS